MILEAPPGRLSFRGGDRGGGVGVRRRGAGEELLRRGGERRCRLRGSGDLERLDDIGDRDRPLDLRSLRGLLARLEGFEGSAPAILRENFGRFIVVIGKGGTFSELDFSNDCGLGLFVGGKGSSVGWL